MPDSLVLPETLAINCLNACINVFMTTDTLRTFQMFEDFDTINSKDCFEVNRVKDMTALPTVFEARLSAFWFVPPRISREELYLEGETPFECWLCVTSWQHPHQNRVADTVAKSMFIGVNLKEDIFVAGHSLGATCANYLVTYQQYQYALRRLRRNVTVTGVDMNRDGTHDVRVHGSS